MERLFKLKYMLSQRSNKRLKKKIEILQDYLNQLNIQLLQHSSILSKKSKNASISKKVRVSAPVEIKEEVWNMMKEYLNSKSN